MRSRIVLLIASLSLFTTAPAFADQTNRDGATTVKEKAVPKKAEPGHSTTKNKVNKEEMKEYEMKKEKTEKEKRTKKYSLDPCDIDHDLPGCSRSLDNNK